MQDYSTEAQVYFEGSDRITVDIPGATDANAVLQELGKPGTLIFCTDSSDPEGTKVMDGNQIKDAQAGARSNATTNAREYVVNLTLTSDGVEAFSKATEELAPTKGRIYIMYELHPVLILHQLPENASPAIEQAVLRYEYWKQVSVLPQDHPYQ